MSNTDAAGAGEPQVRGAEVDHTSFPHNPCATCGACCRSYVVPVCGYDVWLISTGQRLGPEQFVVACPQEEPGFDGFRLEAAGTTYGLALDKQGRFHPTQPCVFLMKFANGHMRCGIYPQRPSVCRVYPMSIWNGMVYKTEESLCPPGAWPEDEPQRPNWRAALQRMYMHYDIYNEVVARWNARVARAGPGMRFTLHEYLSYLLNVYGRLAALNSQLGDEQLVKVQASWPTVPRPSISLAELRVRVGQHPWLDYLMRARGVIDSFYPEVEPLPLLVLMPNYSASGPSHMPSGRVAQAGRRAAGGRY
jgi:Fe-S-cluster containining protein